MSSTASKNKQRGRAFQAKLAEMSGGMNIGTLGGEDVMHDEFSYEAKTYHPKAKSNKGRDWVGEKWMTEMDHGNLTLKRLIYIEHESEDTVVMLRWHVWEAINIYWPRVYGWCSAREVTKFKGYKYLEQAEVNCPDGKMPVVVVHTIGRRHKFDIVLLYQTYWKSLLEKFSRKNY